MMLPLEQVRLILTTGFSEEVTAINKCGCYLFNGCLYSLPSNWSVLIYTHLYQGWNETLVDSSFSLGNTTLVPLRNNYSNDI